MAAIAVASIVSVAIVVAYAVHRGGGAPSATPSLSPTIAPLPMSSPRPSVLAPLASTAAVPTPAAMRANLSAAAARVAAGATLVGEVIDARTGARLWSRAPRRAQPPASTAKLLTAAAALRDLGPAYRLPTQTRLVGRTVYLVGGGDPTIVRGPSSAVVSTYPTPARLSTLAKETAAALGPGRRVRLRLDTSAWAGPALARGWKASYLTEGDIAPPSPLEVDEGRLDPDSEYSPRTANPAAQAGEVFATLLAQDGVQVIGATRAGTAPAAARTVAQVHSPPVAALVQQMLTESDDDLAEALGRAVAIQDHRPATFHGAAAAVTSSVAALGVPIDGLVLHDASGLSHRDRVAPRTLTAVLRLATSPAQPRMRPIIEGLPVAGLTGTLALRYLGGPSRRAAGVLRAKTGTLSGVNALAGQVVDRSGRLLIFDFQASNVSVPGETVPALDTLASRLEHCGCTG